MGSSAPPRKGEPQFANANDPRAWRLLVFALLAWQGWLTLTLFDAVEPWKRLLDHQPLLSGRHPLHLYHGYLGARALRQQGSLSCYDPCFHAGYPKTPVFDSGSRPAELMMTLAGGQYCPAAYKIGVALICASVPLLLFVAARSVGMKRAPACLACLFGMLVWWGQPCRERLEGGDVDLLLAALLVLTQAGLLIRYHTEPGPLSWLGVVAAALLGWFAHPLLLALLMPPFLIYYLSVGARHRLSWHLALLGGLLGAIAANGFWLMDWIGYWWIRVPPHLETPLLTEPSLGSVWESSFWGAPIDKALTCFLVLVGTAGVLMYNQSGQRATARLLGLSLAGFLALSVASLIWEPLGRFGAERLLAPALFFAVVPAAHALTVAFTAIRSKRRLFISFALACCFVVVGAALRWRQPPPALASWATRLQGAAPLRFGLDEDQQAIVEILRQHTTEEARILWEDRALSPLCSHWTPLLPLLTQRMFLGGLDAETRIEHTTNGLADAVLMGRPIREWNDAALDTYCTRYNIGWVACWSAAACERLSNWPQAHRLAALPPTSEGESAGCLFLVHREHYSFALTGSAHWLSADTHRIVFSDVALPSDGSNAKGTKHILLSLHYQAGMRVVPNRVRLDSYSIESVNSVPDDARPFVRLWVDEPVSRVTIIWDKR